ncbi:hypothetical protein Pla175_39750 [Pirellulimonas nuda]|uniref:PIN domain-containing protein n=2 Tax=Pirellulimonas nuda TaxID=2528009 RepID=A0A518DGH0_9BACT|nr:hypothetical protein Pla175_39750 [Pirellulimonas nuda]
MAIKIAIEKLALQHGDLNDFLEVLDKNSVELVPVRSREASDVATLPSVHQQAASGAGGRHQDPFDRLIAAQCLRYDLTLVSVDKQFDAYGVRRVW